MLHQERDKDALGATHLACYFPWIRVKTGAAGEADILHRDYTGTQVSVGNCTCCQGCRRKADTTLPGQKDQPKEHSLTSSGTLEGQRCLLPASGQQKTYKKRTLQISSKCLRQHPLHNVRKHPNLGRRVCVHGIMIKIADAFLAQTLGCH